MCNSVIRTIIYYISTRFKKSENPKFNLQTPCVHEYLVAQNYLLRQCYSQKTAGVRGHQLSTARRSFACDLLQFLSAATVWSGGWSLVVWLILDSDSEQIYIFLLCLFSTSLYKQNLHCLHGAGAANCWLIVFPFSSVHYKTDGLPLKPIPHF